MTAPGRWRSHNYSGLEDARHAALVGLLPGQAIEAGAGSSFVAVQSGLPLLFANDTDVGSVGGFNARVVVEAGW